MTAQQKCEHAAPPFFRITLRQRVIRAAELEGHHALQVLPLEEKPGADQRIRRRGRKDRRAPCHAFDALVRARYVVVRDHWLITSSPHSCRKWPPSAITTGSGQPRIQVRSRFITGGPSTGSFAPTAMNVSPRHECCSQSRAFLEIAAPGTSYFSCNSCGQRRTTALLASYRDGDS